MAGRRSLDKTKVAGGDDDDVARAAWLHFVGGLTQSEIAKRLMVPATRVHRYIVRAQSEGLVRVSVDASSAECVAIEMQLAETFGLSWCRVAMDVPEQTALPLRALAAVGSSYLLEVAASGAHGVIGIGHGRTIAAAVGAMGKADLSRIRFVSMLGGLTRSYAANPYDVIHTLARQGKADAYMMPAPMFVNSAEDKRVMMAQSGIAATMDLIGEATLAVVGIGELDEGSGASTIAALESPEAVKVLKRRGVRAEILGQFLDAEGAVVETKYDARVMAPPLDSLRGREVVAFAGGTGKADAIRAVLRSGLLTGLIIDEATARVLACDRGAKEIAAE